jgi:hypothetical protein
MIHLKTYKLFESSIFNSELEDILLELSDLGYVWKIETKAWSQGQFMLELNISNTSSVISRLSSVDEFGKRDNRLNVDNFKEMSDCLLRIKDYMTLSGYELKIYRHKHFYELLEAGDWERLEKDPQHYMMSFNIDISFFDKSYTV